MYKIQQEPWRVAGVLQHGDPEGPETKNVPNGQTTISPLG